MMSGSIFNRRKRREQSFFSRRSFSWTSDLARQDQGARLSGALTQTSLESYAREQSEFDGQSLKQARELFLLSPEELALFEKLQSQRRQSQNQPMQDEHQVVRKHGFVLNYEGCAYPDSANSSVAVGHWCVSAFVTFWPGRETKSFQALSLTPCFSVASAGCCCR
jgi:hypothetical protein